MNLQSYREIALLKRGLAENMVFPSNYISTRKYTIFSFIPKNLFLQFQREEALWFLVISILQVLPFSLSPLASWGTLTPLCFILFVSMCKDAYNNYRRMKSDEEINHRQASVIEEIGFKFEKVYWESIRVGSLIELKANDPSPADIVILSTSDENGLAYVETSNLDGESSLQQKFALKETSVIFEGSLSNIKEKLKNFKDATLKIEQPNDKLNFFEGYLKLRDFPNDISIHIDNLIIRGSKVKNVKTILGVVVFTGHDTKLMMNSQISNRNKRTRVQLRMKNYLGWIFSEIFILAVISTLVSIARVLGC